MKQIKYLLLIIPFLVFGCLTHLSTNDSWTNIFTQNKAKGTFVLLDINNNTYRFHNESRADQAYLPASTFKVLNSLIGLETKVVADEKEIFKWDGILKGLEEWNRDQNMKTAMATSCVWYYQELARRINPSRMQYWLSKVHYGNENTASQIHDFWLKGSLRISAKEQVAFLQKLVRNELPFQLKHQETVKRIMITDSTANYVIHSKTGWATFPKPQIGWLIGYVEKGEKTWVFAMNIDINQRADTKLRKKITYEILRAESIID